MSRSAITIAVGKAVYFEMAIALARSFKVWNDVNKLPFYIATDNLAAFPKDIAEWARFVPLKKGELGEGFTPKLYLDKLVQTECTLFIDADCLVTGNLDFVFDRFSGHPVSVVGNYISSGEWFGDIGAICSRFGVQQMPKFNGGIYYIEKGAVSSKVYQKARELENEYDEIGFIRLRGRPNDEVVISLAMALNDQTPIDEYGDVMADPLNFATGMVVSVHKGVAILRNDPSDKFYRKNWPMQVAYPKIVHFLGDQTDKMPYIREAYILKSVFSKHRSYRLAAFLSFFFVEIRFYSKYYLKFIFRPMFRLFIGYNKVKPSLRVQ